jgi:hypothetical protein
MIQFDNLYKNIRHLRVLGRGNVRSFLKSIHHSSTAQGKLLLMKNVLKPGNKKLKVTRKRKEVLLMVATTQMYFSSSNFEEFVHKASWDSLKLRSEVQRSIIKQTGPAGSNSRFITGPS